MIFCAILMINLQSDFCWLRGKNKTVVEYSLSGYQNPIGVADWQNQLTQSLPEEFQSSLPSIEEIEKELE